ncbi:PhoU domain-containing protein [Ferviditalea candida]|uniref:PhoU domain-containing protein n=1 Tax=Ferviditalea candida TaxID=3108399 RepID=A0ABU5ZM21_9BACL|nr:PhoU domain-containing protein [Paenibacillaceae bacterium T2]
MEHRKNLDLALKELQTILEEMGQRVNRSIIESIDSIKEQDPGKAKLILDRDRELNALEEKIMEIGASNDCHTATGSPRYAKNFNGLPSRK